MFRCVRSMAATIPVREPALVGSGGTPTHIADGGHIGGSGGTPVALESHLVAVAHCPTHRQVAAEIRLLAVAGAMVQAVADPMVRAAGPRSDGGPDRGTGKEWDPSQGDPVLSDADYGLDHASIPTRSVATPSKPIMASRWQITAR